GPWQALLLRDSPEQGDVVGVLLRGSQPEGVDPSAGREGVPVVPLREHNPSGVRYNDIEVLEREHVRRNLNLSRRGVLQLDLSDGRGVPRSKLLVPKSANENHLGGRGPHRLIWHGQDSR